MNDNKDLLIEAREYEAYDAESNPDGELIHRLANALESEKELLAVALAANAALAEALEAATVERAEVEARALEKAAREMPHWGSIRGWLRARAVGIREGRQ